MRWHSGAGQGHSDAAPLGPGAGRLRIVAGLVEAVLAPERREVEVVCIRPGLSRNGNLYSADVVRGMAPLFEGARAFADHPAPGERPERSIRDIVGYYKDPRIDDAGALRATLHTTRNADWLWTLIEEAVGAPSEEDRPELIGISIDADARVSRGTVEGRQVRVVEAITRLNSCDVVTRASAGGRLERLLQADNGSWWDEYAPLNERTAELQDRAAGTGAPIAAQQAPLQPDAGTVPPVQIGPTLAAAIPGGRVIAGGTYVTEGGTMSGEEAVAEAAGLSALRAELEATRRLLECERTLARELAGCTLPAPIKARLERRFSGRIFESDELSLAMADERELLAALTDAGMIRGMGYEKSVRVGMSETERLQKAFDQLFDIHEGEKVPALSGIREAYVVCTGDPGITGVTAPERLREADVTTSSFSFLLGTSMNKRLLKDYQACPSVPIP